MLNLFSTIIDAPSVCFMPNSLKRFLYIKKKKTTKNPSDELAISISASLTGPLNCVAPLRIALINWLIKEIRYSLTNVCEKL